MWRKRLIIFICWSVVASIAAAQDAEEQTTEKLSVRITAHSETPTAEVQKVVELVKEKVAEVNLQVSEDGEDIAVTIIGDAESEAAQELATLLSDAGIENVDIQPATLKWAEFSFDKLEEFKKAKGTVVFLRADWCATCVFIEREAYADTELLKVIKKLDIPLMIVDMTDPDVADNEGMQLAEQLGIKVVPTLLFYSPNHLEQPQVFTDVIKSNEIIRLLKEHFPSK